MKTRTIGHLSVSPIGKGCMGFSHGYGKTPERAVSIDAIRRAAEFGCHFFDTAESYGREMFYPGHNEELVGEALAPFRKEVVLATKFHLDPADTDPAGDLYRIISDHLDASMKRLQTDYIDLYYLHRVNELVPVESVAAVMSRLIGEGRIRGWGLSQVSTALLSRAHAVCPVTAVQNIYNLAERDMEQELFPYCLEHGIGVVAFSPTSSGLFSGKITADTPFEGDDVRKFVPQLSKENLAANQPIIDVLRDFAARKGTTPVQISLAWMLHKYPNVVPIEGAKALPHILENLASWDVAFTDEEFTELEAALARCTIYGHRGCVETEQNSFGKHWENEDFHK